MSILKDKTMWAIFLIGLLVHLGAVLFIYYFNFKPFGGGADYDLYHAVAKEISIRFKAGNFSLSGLYTEHFFPILIGILYMLTLPNMIIGQLFTVLLAAISILLTYLIVLEIGGAKKIAFLAGIIVSFYPSYLYFGSVLLKDTLVIPFALAGILLILKMIKNFSWLKFLLFFAVLTCLINLRFYIGYALMFAFIMSWPLLSEFNLNEKITYWLTIIFLLGFSPQIAGNGYYASDSFKDLLNPEKITYYREVLYNNPPVTPQAVTIEPTIPQPTIPQPTIPQPTIPQPTIPQPTLSKQEPAIQDLNGGGSNFELETGLDEGILQFSKNSLQSFFYSLSGPFPWQFRYQRQIVSLAETIPWYLLIIISFYGFIRFIKKRGILEFFKFYRFSLPLLIFSVLALGALSLFINNYGIIARIRIPVFICLLSIMFISFNDDIENYYKKIHEKIFNHRRGRFHWISSFRNTFKIGA
ncbi:MAG: glycosyltransferase family 39 protein [Candidatus Staskawiczbacteria bacterium]|nr:glycosyltransferase family 39 protein [Candidatus Staskawiczbacteria bacterium]MBI3337219.1 glycosyltransferase family 39 protein [Candidatus Staskawiczbacteria bacterium]